MPHFYVPVKFFESNEVTATLFKCQTGDGSHRRFWYIPGKFPVCNLRNPNHVENGCYKPIDK